jgi:hypothetical protein
MAELVRFEFEDGTVVAELDDKDPGIERAAREGGQIVQALTNLDGPLEHIRRLAGTTISKFQELAERPDEIELEFGVRLNAQAGAVIARTEAEGHLQVTLTWRKPTQ